MADPINFGIIGAGGIARRWAEACAKVPDAQLVGVWDLVPEAATSFCADLGGQPYPSFEALIDDPDIAAVLICTPNPAHCPQTIEAASSGKHVLVEKPMALNVRDCELMIAACEESEVQLMVGQALRFYTPFAGCLDLVRRGELGRVLGVEMLRLGAPADPAAPRGWRADEAITGGWLLELNIHEIDYMQTLLGVPEKVCAFRSNLLKPATPLGYDLLNVTFVAADGRQGHLLAGEIAAGPGVFQYVVLGEKMTVRWFDWGDKLHLTRPGSTSVEIIQVPAGEAQIAQLTAFCAALRGEAPVPVTGREGLDAVATCLRVQKAWESGGAA
ncbi:MAG TPA: Gfo/Idh/MocA family oxidoreductase [Armatimonadota bacterium]|jgi:predicted dehydrogenase